MLKRKIRITQIDGKLPNIALMKLAHFHKSQGDEVVFQKSVTPYVWEPEYDKVYGSAIFSTSQKKIDMFYRNFPNALVGGTGTEFNHTIESVIGVTEYENYDYDIYPYYTASIGFSQRGCRLRCKFCVVPKKEGRIKSLNSIYEIWKQNPINTKKQILLLDNDFFGQDNWGDISEEIIQGKYKICFSQGINIRLINQENAKYLAKMNFRDDSFRRKRIYTAWDNKKDEDIFLRGVNYLLNSGIKPSEIMVYFLCNYWENGLTNDVWYRFSIMQDIGLLPYPMIYNKWEASEELKKFQEWVIRGAYHATPFSTFTKENKRQYFNRKLKTEGLF